MGKETKENTPSYPKHIDPKTGVVFILATDEDGNVFWAESPIQPVINPFDELGVSKSPSTNFLNKGSITK